MINECTETLRNEINYASDISIDNYSLTGLKVICIFNELPSYHVARNVVCDIMHDLIEGVARYDMALIVKNLIDLKFFSLEILNNRLELFDYGVTEIKNTPPKKNTTYLTNGSIIMSASEMLCLVRYFGLIIGNLVPRKNEIWRLYTFLHKIIDLCFSIYLQPECHIYLNK